MEENFRLIFKNVLCGYDADDVFFPVPKEWGTEVDDGTSSDMNSIHIPKIKRILFFCD